MDTQLMAEVLVAEILLRFDFPEFFNPVFGHSGILSNAIAVVKEKMGAGVGSWG